MHAYNNHLPLVISPDDIWICIMTQVRADAVVTNADIRQFSFFMKDNSEKFRSHFVEHKGKKELIVIVSASTYETVSVDEMCDLFQAACHREILDKEFAAWAQPTFSTTTQIERTIYA